MLYISTRDRNDAFTAARTLNIDCAPDGGLFVPFRLPVLTKDEILEMKGQSFGQNMAQILNLFFSARLTGWDVDFAIGRNPVKKIEMSHRIVVAELWHNPGASYDYIVNKLYERICLTIQGRKPTEWFRVAVRIAVLFGIFADLINKGTVSSSKPADIAVAADDLTLAMACLYARKMGLPVGVIICGCNCNSGLWDLIRRGEYNPFGVPENNVLANERLIQAAFGCEEAFSYAQICKKGRIFSLNEQALADLSKGMFAAVVGNTRIASVVASVQRSGKFCLTDTDAIAYGALQDYRASITEGRVSIILADSRPETA